ncbi:hypothetical protein D3C75_951470 [compost metagenome]
MLLMTPPRVWPDLKKMPRGTGYSMRRPDTSISSNPPDVSLPKVMPAWASRTMQSRTFTWRQGRATRSPSQSRPALMHRASSLTAMSQRSTSTRSDESISIPSVEGPRPPRLLRMIRSDTFTSRE